MHNAPKPKPEDLPTKGQLRRSSIIAGIGVGFTGLAVYMPAELGQDPTGIGTILGLTQMGEIKQQLQADTEADALLHSEDQSSLMNDIFGLFVSTAHAQEVWQDTITFTLEPGEFTEIKATMKEGETLFYSWTSEGGRINFDLHAHTGGENVTYEKGCRQTEGEGSFETPF